MRADAAQPEVLQFGRGDEALSPDLAPAGVRADLVAGVERGRVVADQDALGEPVGQRPRRAGIPVLPRVVAGEGFRADDPREVAGVPFVVGVPQRVRDLVVGLRDDARQVADLPGVVADAAERTDDHSSPPSASARFAS